MIHSRDMQFGQTNACFRSNKTARSCRVSPFFPTPIKFSTSYLSVLLVCLLHLVTDIAHAQPSTTALSKLCNRGIAAPGPVGSEWCEGVFRITGIPLGYLSTSQLEIAKYLPSLGLNYDSGYAGVDHHGVGAGWFLGPVQMIYLPRSNAPELTLIHSDGSTARLVKHQKGHYYRFGGNPRETFQVASNVVVNVSPDGTVIREYVQFKPNWFALSSVALHRLGEEHQKVTITLATRTAPGALLFSDGKKISWSFSSTTSSWTFKGDRNDAYATVNLDKASRVISAQAVKGLLKYDYRFSYDTSGLLSSFTYSTGGHTVPTTIAYNSSKAPYAVFSTWGTVRLSRRQDGAGNGILEVTEPNLVRTRYVYSPNQVLIEKRTYEVRDEADLSKHWNVAFYDYGKAPDGRRALTRVRTQQGGKEFILELTYNSVLPTMVSTVRLSDAQKQLLVEREIRYHEPSGLPVGFKEGAVDLDGKSLRKIQELNVQREQTAPFRVTKVSDLATRSSREYRYENGKQIEVLKDISGESVQEEIYSRAKNGDLLLEHLQDTLGLGISKDFVYDGEGKIKGGTSMSGQNFAISRNSERKITEIRTNSDEGIGTSYTVDPITDRVLKRVTSFPRGQTATTSYTYTLHPDKSIKTVTMRTTQLSGTDLVRRIEFEERGKVISNVVSRKPIQNP